MASPRVLCCCLVLIAGCATSAVAAPAAAAAAAPTADAAAASPTPPFYVLDPSAFAPLLGADLAWATASIPFFEASDVNLTATFFLRARVLHSHIVATNESQWPWVITEFMPDVPWAGRANAIPCANGHHVAEARWLRGDAARVADSYSGWWSSGLPGVRNNYYAFLSHSLLRRLSVAGLAANLPVVTAALPNLTAITLAFMDGTLPGGRGSGVVPASGGCVWNSPGNEGQENSLSGPGCRPLVQSLLYGEAAALATLCGIVGNASCAAVFTERAAFFRARTLDLWNAAIGGFDTLQIPHPPPPPPPPPPSGYTPFASGTFCCDQAPCVNGHSSFLYQGGIAEDACTAKCDAWPGGACHYVTVSPAPWCMVAQWCNTTAPFVGDAAYTYHRSGREGGGAVAPLPSPPLQTPPFANVRELASLSSPWFFGAVPVDNASFFSSSWETAFDAAGLGGRFGLRTVEARAPRYSCGKGSCCEWHGPVWPFETAKALTAAADILQDAALAPQVPALTRARHWALLSQYVAQHTGAWWISDGADTRANYSDIAAHGLFYEGLGVAWIAEAGCAEDGQWTDAWREGYRYLHSSFIDIVIGSVAGVIPLAATATAPAVHVLPLQPSDDALSYWALDAVVVNGRVLTVLWDADGTRYGRGKGLSVLRDGALVAHADTTQLDAPLVVDV